MFKPSQRTQDLKQSGIRSASQRCNAINGINLGQGVCDLPTPEAIKLAAKEAIDNNKSLYSACEGLYPLREAIANKLKQFNHIDVDPATEVVVTHGSTGAFVSAVSTLFNPGDEVILFEPFYGYHKHILELQGINCKPVKIDNDFNIDFEQLSAAINTKTRGIVICTPCNPSGKVFSREELMQIGKIALENNLYVITDEIYEYITYPGHEHISIASMPEFKANSVTISGLSKTYNMTGWRLGYITADAAICQRIALVQDLLYVCPSTPLQHAALAAFALPDSYYTEMQQSYLAKRELVCGSLKQLGFQLTEPQGAYYVIADFSALDFADDQAIFEFLLEKAKVAVVTGRSFYQNPDDGKHCIRVCYALDTHILEQAISQMREQLG